MLVSIENYVIISFIVFAIAVAGMVLQRRNLIGIILCTELMLLAANLLFIAFSSHNHNIDGHIMTLFVLSIAAAEVAIGLGILVIFYKRYQSIDLSQATQLRED